MFSKSSFCQIQDSNRESSWYGFSIILSGNLKNKREYVITELTKQGIETRPIVSGNFLKNPVAKYYEYSVFGDLKNIEKEMDKIIKTSVAGKKIIIHFKKNGEIRGYFRRSQDKFF